MNNRHTKKFLILGLLTCAEMIFSQEPTQTINAPSEMNKADTSTQTNTNRSRIMVEIQGAITRPGAYEFSPETRIYEAIKKAGGAIEHAEIRDINIAARLIDGSVLTIPYRQNYQNASQATAAQLNPSAYTRSGSQSTSPPPARENNDSGGEESGCINLNTASQEALERLPGVGEKTAQKIIQYRTLQPFQQLEDLLNVQGIGEKRLAAWRPQLCL